MKEELQDLASPDGYVSFLQARFIPTNRRQPRLVYQASLYQKVISLNPSPANGLEFSVDALAECTEGGFHEAVEILPRVMICWKVAGATRSILLSGRLARTEETRGETPPQRSGARRASHFHA